MRLLLLQNKLDIVASQEEKYSFVMDIASGYSNFEKIVKWLANHTVKTSG